MLAVVDGVAVGILGIVDTPRMPAVGAVHRLRDAQIRRIVMLTGDNSTVAQSIADKVGVDEIPANLLPDENLRFISQLQSAGYVVAMVGDGINDAPSLATADIGVAMGLTGSDIAMEAADIALMTDDLNRMVDAIQLSRATVRTIRENVAIALVVVTALLIGVILGDVQMAGGMLVHEFPSWWSPRIASACCVPEPFEAHAGRADHSARTE